MEHPQYDRVRVALGDSDPKVASALKDALHDRGVIEVIQCDSVERLFRALDDEIVDLLIYDYHMLDNRFVEVMQRIRRKEVGQNPFITIVATIRESKADTVRQLIDAGVDDLIRAPVSIDRVFATMEKSTKKRRPFVVTYEYVGPMRPVARTERKASPEPGVVVPNTLKSRTIDAIPEEEIRAALETAVQAMVAQQLESCGKEIEGLAKQVLDNYASIEGSERNVAMRGKVGQVAVFADDLRKRVTGTPSERVCGLANTLIPIAQRILDAPTGRAAVEVQLLSQLATAVRRALTTEPGADPAIREIANTVSDFAGRTAPQQRAAHA